ncbi:hypothetical protein ACOMHN_013676 [Nucella lapillus]
MTEGSFVRPTDPPPPPCLPVAIMEGRPPRLYTSDSGCADRDKVESRPVMPRKPRGYRVPTMPASERSYTVTPSERSYTVPPPERSYTGSPSECSYTGSPSERSYTGSPSERSYTGSPSERSYTMSPSERSYTVPPYEQSYTLPPSEQSYIVPPSERSYTSPRPEQSQTLPRYERSYTVPLSDQSYTQSASEWSYIMSRSEPSHTLAKLEQNYKLPRSEQSYTPPKSEQNYTPPKSEQSCYILPMSERDYILSRSERTLARSDRTLSRFQKALARSEGNLPTPERTLPRAEKKAFSRPEKYSLFVADGQADRSAVTARQVFEGRLGPLPMLLTVPSGWSADGVRSSLGSYETSEVLFAYKQDKQFRVLLIDSYQRTLSLPVHSRLTFCTEDAMKEELTLPQILSQYCLPVDLRIARSQELLFVVDKAVMDHTFFGPLRLTAVYDESFYWCLSIEPYGNARSSPKVLPQNLVGVTFAPVTGIRGASNPLSKLREFVDRYSHLARRVPDKADPFCPDLALVSHGPVPVVKVEPYIDEKTFITIIHNRQQSPVLPYAHSLQTTLSSTDLAVCGRQRKSSASTVCGEDAEDLHYEQPFTALPKACMPLPPSSNSSDAFSTDTDSRASSPGWDENDVGSTNINRPQARNPSPPPVPQRQRCQDFSEKASYDVPRFVHIQKQTSTLSRSADSLSTVKEGKEWGDKPKGSSSPSLPGQAWKDTLDSLTVEELSVKLKELGLHKYRKKFSKARIDGVLLQKLTADSLREEFHMQQLEMIRLNAFISEGHVPKHTVRRSRSSVCKTKR